MYTMEGLRGFMHTTCFLSASVSFRQLELCRLFKSFYHRQIGTLQLSNITSLIWICREKRRRNRNSHSGGLKKMLSPSPHRRAHSRRQQAAFPALQLQCSLSYSGNTCVTGRHTRWCVEYQQRLIDFFTLSGFPVFWPFVFFLFRHRATKHVLKSCLLVGHNLTEILAMGPGAAAFYRMRVESFSSSVCVVCSLARLHHWCVHGF